MRRASKEKYRCPRFPFSGALFSIFRTNIALALHHLKEKKNLRAYLYNSSI